MITAKKEERDSQKGCIRNKSLLMLAKMLSKGDELIAVVSRIAAYVGTNDSSPK